MLGIHMNLIFWIIGYLAYVARSILQVAVAMQPRSVVER